ncbi:hypothetical protein ACWEOA_37575 [Streptomyces sp. NPDC004457]
MEQVRRGADEIGPAEHLPLEHLGQRERAGHGADGDRGQGGAPACHPDDDEHTHGAAQGHHGDVVQDPVRLVHGGRCLVPRAPGQRRVLPALARRRAHEPGIDQQAEARRGTSGRRQPRRHTHTEAPIDTISSGS